jgi:hypothetical protein
LVARGITEFNRGTPSGAQELRLPDWNNSATTAWLRRDSDLSMFMPPSDPRFTAAWSSPEVQAAGEAAARAERERIGKFYVEQTRLREERIKAGR